jgi:hypothetical protein
MQDPWDDILAGIKGHPCVNEETGAEEERITSDELFRTYLELPPGKTQNGDALRLKRSMRRLGWSGPKKLRITEGPKRGYFREVSKVRGTGGTGRNVERCQAPVLSQKRNTQGEWNDISHCKNNDVPPVPGRSGFSGDLNGGKNSEPEPVGVLSDVDAVWAELAARGKEG